MYDAWGFLFRGPGPYVVLFSFMFIEDGGFGFFGFSGCGVGIFLELE